MSVGGAACATTAAAAAASVIVEAVEAMEEDRRLREDLGGVNRTAPTRVLRGEMSDGDVLTASTNVAAAEDFFLMGESFASNDGFRLL
jgi:hypothetical protein